MSDQNQKKLGDPVNMSSPDEFSNAPVPGGLEHPTGDVWASAEDVSSMREPVPATAQAQAPAQVPVVTPRPIPEVTRVTTKETKTLAKFRSVFGMSRVKIKEGEVTRLDPEDPTRNITMKFGFRGLGYEDYQWVRERVPELMQSVKLAPFAWKLAIVAVGTAHLDGVPMWEVFGFVPENPSDVSDPMSPKRGLRIRSAELFLEELNTTLFDFVDYLYAQYEDLVDSQFLPKKEVKETKKDVPLVQAGSGS